MAIALVGTPTTFEPTSASTTVTNSVPTGVANGNLLIWIISGAISSTPTTPTGWNVMETQAGSGLSTHVYWRAASSEPASYNATVASGRWTGLMLAFSGVDTTTPEDVASSVSVGTSATAFNAITPTTAGAWVFAVATGAVGAGVTTGTHTSSNLDAIDGTSTVKTSGSVNAVITAGHEVWSSGAFTPVMTMNTATTRSNGISIALRPSAGGGTTHTAAAALSSTAALASVGVALHEAVSALATTAALAAVGDRVGAPVTHEAAAALTVTAALATVGDVPSSGPVTSDLGPPLDNDAIYGGVEMVDADTHSVVTIITDNFFDTDSGYTLDSISWKNQTEISGTTMSFELRDAEGITNFIRYLFSTDTWYCRITEGGVLTTVSTFTQAAGQAEPWFRIRISGADLLWETSDTADFATPTVRATHAYGSFPMTNLFPRWQVGTAGTGAWTIQEINGSAAPLFQFLVPNGDLAVTGWSTQAGGTTNLYTVLDEEPASDADYIRYSL